jgi:hypothetical protein
MASKATFRPTKEQAPWYKTSKASTWNTPDWPIGYTVPNFGVDHDVMSTQQHIASAEGALKHQFQASFEKPKGHPVDYFVPNFGKDRDLVINDINLADAERQHSHSLQASFDTPKGHPVDYAVPNFGVDHDIVATHAHLAAAEAQHKQKLTGDFFDDKTPKYPINFTVPNFGVDHDIAASQHSANAAEAALGHRWVPTKDANGAYTVPSTAAVQLESEVSSDPICSSAGCDQYEHPKIKTHPMDYFVPDFGVDHDIQAAHSAIAQAETQLNHKWVPQEVKDGADKDYFVPNFGVDQDIKDTNASLDTSEGTVGHTWTPTQDKNGYWNVP